MTSPEKSPPAPPGIWQHALSSALRFDWSQIEPVAALRCTIGVGVPLLAALLLDRPGWGTFLAIGAVSAGFGSFQGAYRSRAATMFFAALGMAVSLFVGSIAGHSTPGATTVATVWGFAAGLLVALGPAAAFVALQSTVAVLVATAYPADLGEALGRGLLVLSGGLGQMLLVVSLWPLKRFHNERMVIGTVYRSLADYAGSLPQRPTAPEPHTLARMGGIHLDPQPFARSSELLVFHGLLADAERLRDSLAALSLSPGRDQHALAAHLSAVLRELANAVEEGRAPARLAREWDALKEEAAVPGGRGTPLTGLLTQLRGAWRMATVPANEPPTGDDPTVRIRTIPPVRNALITIRANLSLRSSACRHALRLAVALALATAIYRLTNLPRGYWFPMTTLLVLKPEFRETYVIGVTRMLGTLAGAGLAAFLVTTLGAHPAVVAALLLLFVWSGFTLFRANYTAFTICITGYIVLLLYLANVPGPATATYRALDTLLGGGLALVIYRLWPTWESSQLQSVLAIEVEALARDTGDLLSGYIDPGKWDPKQLRQTRAAARLARSNAEASVERMLSEPHVGARVDAELALNLLAAFRRYALGALALHAGIDTRPTRAQPQLAELRDQITSGLQVIATGLRHSTAPEPMPPLRHTFSGLEASLDPVLAEPIDLLVESVETIATLLQSPPHLSAAER